MKEIIHRTRRLHHPEIVTHVGDGVTPPVSIPELKVSGYIVSFKRGCQLTRGTGIFGFAVLDIF